jgi:hypothetical protein
MLSNNYSAKVLDIQLTEFSYKIQYDFATLDEVELKVSIMHRLPDKERYDVMVKIDYLDKKNLEPVLSTVCVTSYSLAGLDYKANKDDENRPISVDIPEDLVRIMNIEAVAHARALVAQQAASTPFGKTYVSLGTRVLQQFVKTIVEDVTKGKKK